MSFSKIKFISSIVASIFIFPAVIYSFKKFQENTELRKSIDPKYQIDTIVQTGLVKEALPSLYLAELMDLSIDRPQNLAHFSETAAAEKLLGSPVIKHARVKKIPPSTIYVDYEIRTPIATLVDFTNTAIDKEGVTFPLSPFFAPRRLPEIYFGLNECPKQIDAEKTELVLCILEMLRDHNPNFVSVADAFHQSYGKREIVVIFNNEENKHFLRLSTKNYPQELGNYLTIKDQFSKEVDHIIDLRIANLAYLEEVRGK